MTPGPDALPRPPGRYEQLLPRIVAQVKNGYWVIPCDRLRFSYTGKCLRDTCPAA